VNEDFMAIPSTTRKNIRTLAVALAAGAWLAPLAARAQERDPAAAQALFDQARQLARQGRYNEACPKLVESNRLDPGIGTQFHLADCYEHSGRIASAWATFLDVASQARASGQSDREKAAQKRAERLEPRLPRLELNVAAAARAPGLEVRRNGVLIGAAQWGTPVPVDPGEIEIVATAPDRRPLTQTLRLEEGKTASFDLPPLALAEGKREATASAERRSEQPSTAEPVGAAAAPHHDTEPERAGTSPWVFALAGLGAVGVGVGATFGMMARSTYEDSKEDCQPDAPNRCGPRGVELRNEAIGKGDVATVAFIAGGALLAGAGVLWLVDRPSEPRSGLALQSGVAVGPGNVGLYTRGSF
jgi:hypothetical protein